VAATGERHALRVCGIEQKQEGRRPRPEHVIEVSPSAPDNFAPLDDPHAVARIAVTVADAERARKTVYAETSSHRLLGTLVHRLFDRAATAFGSQGGARVAEELARLVRDEECREAEALDGLLLGAADAYRALCAQPELSAALESGRPLFEVPFSVRPATSPSILRGTFDCLVQRNDGGVTILELKTGRPMPEHEQQLATYLVAARALFPDAPVEGKLVYARQAGREHETKQGGHQSK
jgi:RecB family exonuclease